MNAIQSFQLAAMICGLAALITAMIGRANLPQQTESDKRAFVASILTSFFLAAVMLFTSVIIKP